MSPALFRCDAQAKRSLLARGILTVTSICWYAARHRALSLAVEQEHSAASG